MTIAAIVTEGIGPGSAIKFVITGGFDIGAAVVRAGQIGKKSKRREIVLPNGVRIVTNSDRIDVDVVPDEPEPLVASTMAPKPKLSKPDARLPLPKGGILGEPVESAAPILRDTPRTITAEQVGRLFAERTWKAEAKRRAEAEEAARQAELDDEEALLHMLMLAA